MKLLKDLGNLLGNFQVFQVIKVESSPSTNFWNSFENENGNKSWTWKGVFVVIPKVFFRPDIDIDIELKFLMMRLWSKKQWAMSIEYMLLWVYTLIGSLASLKQACNKLIEIRRENLLFFSSKFKEKRKIKRENEDEIILEC